MATPEPPVLAPRYYRDNFQHLCDTVETLYGDLLQPEEHAWLAQWRAASEPAQCLYVRLVSRVGPWFRVNRLDYPEIGAVEVPLAELHALDLLLLPQEASEESLQVQDLDRLFTLPEWRRAFRDRLTAAAQRSKAQWVAAVEGLAEPVANVLQALCAATSERLVAPLGVDTVGLFQLLFFGNRRQTLTDFVLSDLGINRYYPYVLTRAQRRFPCREAVDEYRQLGELADRHWLLEQAGEAEDFTALAEALLDTPPRHATSERRYWLLCNRLGRNLERSGDWTLAGRLYQRSQLHPARERHLRVLEQRGCWQEAQDACTELLQSPWCEEERDAARRILPRLQRQLGLPPTPRRRQAVPVLDLALPQTETRVEIAVAEHLADGEWDSVHYVENSLFNSLFGLAFWEQIFAPVPGAFHNPFQAVPADMYQAGFRSRREVALARRLRELATGDLAAELQAALQRYAGYQCRWVSWPLLHADFLARVTACIPREHLLAVWERILFDPGENRRGFPDLIALGEGPGAYCLVEVKGPGDQLQHSQRRWLQFFGDQGIPAKVARVVWTDG